MEVAVAALASVDAARDAWWRFMLNTFPEFGLYSYVFWAVIVAGYLLGGGLFYLLDYFDLFPQYKIQQKV